MRELARESGRVFQVRRRTEEDCGHILKVELHLVTKSTIERLLSQLEKQVNLTLEQQCDLKPKCRWIWQSVGSDQLT